MTNADHAIPAACFSAFGDPNARRARFNFALDRIAAADFFGAIFFLRESGIDTRLDADIRRARAFCEARISG
jgi:hypothetical protein